MEIEQFTTPLLGEHHQKSRLRIRHIQVEHSRRLPIGDRFDFYGLLFAESPRPKQGVPVGQALVLQRSAQVPQMGGVLLLGDKVNAIAESARLRRNAGRRVQKEAGPIQQEQRLVSLVQRLCEKVSHAHREDSHRREPGCGHGLREQASQLSTAAGHLSDGCHRSLTHVVTFFPCNLN